MFILQLLGIEGLCHWKSFTLAAFNSNHKEQLDHVWEAFKRSFRQTSSFRNYREQTINNFCQQKNESIADLHKRLAVLLLQCCMNTYEVDLFIHTVKYFTVYSWARKQPADVVSNRIPDKAKSHNTARAEYHHDKANEQDSVAFPVSSLHFHRSYLLQWKLEKINFQGLQQMWSHPQ